MYNLFFKSEDGTVSQFTIPDNIETGASPTETFINTIQTTLIQALNDASCGASSASRSPSNQDILNSLEIIKASLPAASSISSSNADIIKVSSQTSGLSMTVDLSALYSGGSLINKGISNVYIVIKAQDTNNNACFLNLSNPSSTTCDVVNANTDSTSSQYSLDILSSPNYQKDYTFTFYAPFLTAARMYFSINYPMVLPIVSNVNGDLTITDPNAFNVMDPNYYTLFDKIELTYNEGGSWINPTAVDFISLPLSLSQPTSTSDFVSSGLTDKFTLKTGAAAACATTLGAPWSDLVMQYSGSAKDTTSHSYITVTNQVLRVVAPNEAFNTGPMSTNTNFDNNYLSSYISSLWSYYQLHILYVDCSELAQFGTVLSDYTFFGQTNASDNLFYFSSQGGQIIFPISQPDTYAFFGASGGAFSYADGTVGVLLVRAIASALNVGLLPDNALPNGMTQSNPLGKAYFKNHNNLYYQSTSNDVPYNHYSGCVKGLGNTIYNYAYSDILGIDGTLQDPNAGPVTISLKNIDVPIPDVKQTTSAVSYNAQLIVGKNDNGCYYAVSCNNNNIVPGTPLTTGSFTGVLQVVFKSKTYSIYLGAVNSSNNNMYDLFIDPYDTFAENIVVHYTNGNIPPYVIEFMGVDDSIFTPQGSYILCS